MFVMGNHLEIHKGKKWTCINPEIVEVSKQTTRLKEGCLTFPFLFLDIERPSAIKVKYLDEELKEQEEEMIGIVARCFLHEYDHMQGIVFTEKVTKFKLDYALKKRDKEIKRVQKLWQQQNQK
jgi:peptide deformylase